MRRFEFRALMKQRWYVEWLVNKCLWILKVSKWFDSIHRYRRHGRRKDFFQGEPREDFSKIFLREAKIGEICFFPLETKKTTIFCWKNPGGPCHSFPRPWSQMLGRPANITPQFCLQKRFIGNCIRIVAMGYARVT